LPKQGMTDSEIAVTNIERELCKRDVCMYCGGRAIGYARIPEGPNEAGNWVHEYRLNKLRDGVLCKASAIFNRVHWESTRK